MSESVSEGESKCVRVTSLALSATPGGVMPTAAASALEGSRGQGGREKEGGGEEREDSRQGPRDKERMDKGISGREVKVGLRERG